MGVKTLRLLRDQNEWLVKYDEDRHAVTVEGPAPDAAAIRKWLTTQRTVLDETTGNLLTVIPVESWAYLRQAVETDLYGELLLKIEL